MKNIPSVILACWFQFMPVINAALTEIDMDSHTCIFKIYEMSIEKPYEMTWTGKKISTDCRLSFISRSTLYEEFIVCAEVTQFNITDCDVIIKFYEGYNDIPVKNYTCVDSIPEKHCAPENTYFDIELSVPFDYTDTSSRVVIRLKSVQTKFDTSSEETDNTSTIVIIIGSTILGIAILGVAVFVCVFFILKRRQRNRFNEVYPPSTAPTAAPVPVQPNRTGDPESKELLHISPNTKA